MPKRPRRANLKPAGTCIFCGGPRMTKAHIWADQLKKIIRQSQPGARISAEQSTEVLGSVWRRDLGQKRRQGDYRQMKVRRVCESCNGGWMRRLEEEAIKIATPVIRGTETHLTGDDQRTIAAWLVMMSTLLEFTTEDITTTVPIWQRVFLKAKATPPDGWIVAIGRGGAETEVNWQRYTIAITSDTSNLSALRGEAPNDTQIATFRVGHLLVQTFNSPQPEVYQSYGVFARSTPLIRIWPPRRWLGVFGRKQIDWSKIREATPAEQMLITQGFVARHTQPPH